MSQTKISREQQFSSALLIGGILLVTALSLLGQTQLLLYVFGSLLVWISIQQWKLSRTISVRTRIPSTISQLLQLAQDPELSAIHSEFVEKLLKLNERQDPIFRELATPLLQSFVEQVKTLAQSTIEYNSTEAWRMAYEQLLRSPGLYLYRSIAHVETPHYWQDGPGQQSTKLNLELHESGTVRIERIAIVADHLWPEGTSFPVDPLHGWIDQQHRHGIWIQLVRESTLLNEPKLLTDCGIYGHRAVGMQLADPAGRTIRFVLSFDYAKVEDAEAIWNRLAVYAISYRDLLDQSH